MASSQLARKNIRPVAQKTNKPNKLVNLDPAKGPLKGLTIVSAHDSSCGCSSCSGKDNVIDGLLSGKDLLTDKTDVVGTVTSHEASCQCDACGGKGNVIDDILSNNESPLIDLSGNDQVTVHDPGCNCSSCDGKVSVVDDLLSGQNDPLTDVTHENGSTTTHDSSCSCSSCGGKDNVIDGLLSGKDLLTDKTDVVGTVTSHEASCQCDACGGKASVIDELVGRSTKLETIIINPDQDRQEQLVNNNDKTELDYVAANEIKYAENFQFSPIPPIQTQETSMTTLDQNNTGSAFVEENKQVEKEEGPVSVVSENVIYIDEWKAKKGVTLEKNSEKTKPSDFTSNGKTQQDQKQYVIGTYTYEDIIATAWLRKLYGHLIGLPPEQESKSYSTVEKTQLPKKNSIDGKVKPENKDEKNPERTVNGQREERLDKKTTKRIEIEQRKRRDDSSEKLSTTKERAEIKEIKKSILEIKRKLTEIGKAFGKHKVVGKQTKELEKRISGLKEKLGKQVIKLERKKRRIVGKINERIEELKHKIKQRKGRIKQLKKKLGKLKTRKFAKEKIRAIKAEIKKLQKEIFELKKQRIVNEARKVLEKQSLKVRKILRSIKSGRKVLKALKSMNIKELRRILKLLENKKIIKWLLLEDKKGRKKGFLKTLISVIKKLLGK